MKLWSRGLGRTEIDMDLRYYEIVKDPQTGYITVIGTMQSPVTWEFTIKLEPDDIAGVIKLALKLPVLSFAIKNLYRYPMYLMNRKNFVLEEGEKLEEKVMATYEKMMSKTKTKDKKKRGSKRKTAASIEVQELATSEA